MAIGSGSEFLTQAGAYSASMICVGSLFRILLPFYFIQYFVRADEIHFDNLPAFIQLLYNSFKLVDGV